MSADLDQEQHLAALLRWMDEAADEEKWDEVLRIGREALAIDPEQEAVHISIATAHLGLKDRAGFLEALKVGAPRSGRRMWSPVSGRSASR